MANNQKKVIVRARDGEVRAGYLPAAGIRDARGALALLTLEARLLPIELERVLHVAYVHDFNLSDAVDPERLGRRTFLARPRSEGLWLRMTLAGGAKLEGLAPLDMGLADGWARDGGVFLLPPDVRSNTLRLFVPHAAMLEMQVLAVITTPARNKAARAEERAQAALFP